MQQAKAIRIVSPKLKSSDRVLVNAKSKAVIITLAVCLLCAAFYVLRVIQNINQPEMEYSEGFMVYLSELFATGQFDYTLQGPPFQVSFYTPVFYYVLGWFGSTLVAGRVIVLVCTLVCMVMVYLIVKRVSNNQIISMIAALLPLTQYIITQWTLILRVDMMALMFELVGVYLALKFWKSAWLLLSIPLFMLAFMSKQTYFVGAIAVALTLFLQGSRARAICYAGIIGTLVIVMIGVANHLTNGGFLTQIFTLQGTLPRFMPIINYFSWVTLSYWPTLPIIIFGLFFVFKSKSHLLVIFAGLAILFNLIFWCRPGAAQNYNFEVIFATAIIGGLGLIEVIKQKQYFYLIIFTIVVLMSSLSPQVTVFPDKDYASRIEEARVVISDANYPILTEKPNLVIEAGKIPYLCDPFMFMNFAALGQWDEHPLLDDLNSKKIPYVVTQFKLPTEKIRRFDDKVQRAILDNYHPVLDYSGYTFSVVVYKAN